MYVCVSMYNYVTLSSGTHEGETLCCLVAGVTGCNWHSMWILKKTLRSSARTACPQLLSSLSIPPKSGYFVLFLKTKFYIFLF